MLTYQGEQTFPQIGVQGHVFLVAHPALGTPLPRPAFRNRIDHVLGVAVDGDAARLHQGFQALDHTQDLHAVVGGEPEAAGQLLTVLPHQQDSAVAARAGVAQG